MATEEIAEHISSEREAERDAAEAFCISLLEPKFCREVAREPRLVGERDRFRHYDQLSEIDLTFTTTDDDVLTDYAEIVSGHTTIDALPVDSNRERRTVQFDSVIGTRSNVGKRNRCRVCGREEILLSLINGV